MGVCVSLSLLSHVCLPSKRSFDGLDQAYSKYAHSKEKPRQTFPDWPLLFRAFIKYLHITVWEGLSWSPWQSGANQIHWLPQKPSLASIIINLYSHLIGTVVNEQC